MSTRNCMRIFAGYAATVLIVGAVLSQGNSVQAEMIPIAVPDSSWEQQVIVPPAISAPLNLATWQCNIVSGTYGGGVQTSASAGFSGATGNQISYIYSNPAASFSGALWESLSTNCEAGSSYNLSVDIAKWAMAASGTMQMRLYAGTTSNIIAAKTIAATDVSTTAFATFSLGTPTMLSTDPGVGQPLGVWLGWTQSAGTAKAWFAFDNVQLSARPVPEPATIVMLASTLSGLLAYAWRKKK